VKLRELRTLSADELGRHLQDCIDSLVRLRVQSVTGELQDHRQLRRLRREVAQIKTLLREEKLSIRKAPGALSGEQRDGT